MELKALLEERATIGKAMNDLSSLVQVDEKRNFNATEIERFDKMKDEFSQLGDKIETLKRVELARSLMSAPEQGYSRSSHRPVEITRQDKELAFKGWALNACGDSHALKPHHLAAMEKVKMPGGSKAIMRLADNPNNVDNEIIERAQTSSVDSQGGYLQNDGIFQSLERNMKWYGGARAVADVIRTETGEPISFGYSDDTGNVGYQLAQTGTATNTNVVYQKKSLGEFTYVTEVEPVSIQLLQDARINVSDDLGEALAIRLGRKTNQAYTTGSGASQPNGFLTMASLGATAATDTIAYGDLTNLYFSVDRAYRELPSFAFTCSDAQLNALWNILDNNGRPLFWNQLANLASGNPLKLFTAPIVVNNDMPAPGVSGNKPICAVTGKKFKIRDVQDIQLIVLRERYMDQLSVGFIAYLRTDSMLINPNTAKYILLP